MTDSNANLIPVDFQQGKFTPPETMTAEFIDQCAEKFSWLMEAPRKFKPAGEVTARDQLGRVFLHGDQDFKVVCSINKQADGNAWLHISFSRDSRIPNYDDVQRVKNIFVGPELYAYEVHPPQEIYLSLYRQCRHLWCPLEGEAVVPKFSQEFFEGMHAR